MLLDSLYSVASSEAHGDVSAERASVEPYGVTTANPLPEHFGVMLVIAPLSKALCSEETSARQLTEELKKAILPSCRAARRSQHGTARLPYRKETRYA